MLIYCVNLLQEHIGRYCLRSLTVLNEKCQNIAQFSRQASVRYLSSSWMLKHAKNCDYLHFTSNTHQTVYLLPTVHVSATEYGFDFFTCEDDDIADMGAV
jgi:hypothetical protein